MNNIKKTGVNRSVIIIFTILIILLLVITTIYFFGFKNREEIVTNTGNLLESNSGSSKTGSGTGPIQPITLDPYIQEIDDTDIDKALKLALKRYNDNGKIDLGDHEQLMYIYIDKGNYKEAIKLGKNALDIINEKLINETGIIKAIVSQLIQAYLYNGDFTSASTLLNKYSDLGFGLEKVMYEYKKGNFKFLIDNFEGLKKLEYHDYATLYVLVSKSYQKKGKLKEATNLYKDLYSFGKSLVGKDSLLETYYCYISSYILLNNFSDNLTQDEFDKYTIEMNFYKTRIDNKEKIEFTEAKTDIYYNPDLMYFNINRIINF